MCGVVIKTFHNSERELNHWTTVRTRWGTYSLCIGSNELLWQGLSTALQQ